MHPRLERVRPLALLAIAALSRPAPVGAQELRVTYLANEGVLVDRGAARVLVDALFRDSLDPYARHSRAVQEALETGQKPFDGVGLALATHFHLDHWDPGAITRFLRSNPAAVFASTEDATGMFPWDVRERVRNLWPTDGQPSRLEAGGAKVTAIPLKHGATQNLAYRLDLSGKTVAHLGDADPSEENFAKLVSAGSVDVALVPFWWLLNAKASSFLKESWKPGAVVALHIGESDLGSLPALRAAWPVAWTPTKAQESRSFYSPVAERRAPIAWTTRAWPKDCTCRQRRSGSGGLVSSRAHRTVCSTSRARPSTRRSRGPSLSRR